MKKRILAFLGVFIFVIVFLAIPVLSFKFEFLQDFMVSAIYVYAMYKLLSNVV